ncbi:MAG TPA: helix-turn-helix domain-containing protein [Firmicutes bacterium]|jgi:transcriptional regulator with XRE-family HTH domain|nr:helix-turn-helix domain-containing protein [Bacillota bacterium]HHT43353.1 helix-turn-helix domain-containing protein [Bacillota bacterium]
MNVLGSRLRQRRRQLGLRQKDVAGEESASFLSKVECGAAHPSLSNLRQWSSVLGTTASDLLGEHLVLEAAKHSILLTDQCLGYLDLLPSSELTDFLRGLTRSAASLSTPVPSPPPDPSLEYLTALVHLHRGRPDSAEEIILGTLSRARSTPWRIFHLSLLCLIYEGLSEPGKKQKAQEDLRSSLAELDHDQLLRSLSEPHLLSPVELDLIKLGAFLKHSHLFLD